MKREACFITLWNERINALKDFVAGEKIIDIAGIFDFNTERDEIKKNAIIIARILPKIETNKYVELLKFAEEKEAVVIFFIDNEKKIKHHLNTIKNYYYYYLVEEFERLSALITARKDV